MWPRPAAVNGMIARATEMVARWARQGQVYAMSDRCLDQLAHGMANRGMTRRGLAQLWLGGALASVIPATAAGHALAQNNHAGCVDGATPLPGPNPICRLSGGSRGGPLLFPNLMAVGPAGEVYVAEAWYGVRVYDASGGFRRGLGTAGGGDRQVIDASGVAVGPAGRVYVADSY